MRESIPARSSDAGPSSAPAHPDTSRAARQEREAEAVIAMERFRDLYLHPGDHAFVCEPGSDDCCYTIAGQMCGLGKEYHE